MTEREKQEFLPTLSVAPDSDKENAVKFPSKGMQIEISSKPRDIQTTYGEKTVVTVEAKDGKKYSVFLNATSINNLVDKFGKEDEDWVGKVCNLALRKDAKYKKNMIVFEAVA